MPSKNTPKGVEDIDPSLYADDAEQADAPALAFHVNLASIPKEDLVPDGWYDGKIVGAQGAKSRNGNPQLKIRWEIYTTDASGKERKRMIFDQITMTENTMWRVGDFMRALGYPDDFNGGVDPEQLLGEHAAIHVIIKPGDGINPETQETYAARNEVKKYLPLAKMPAPRPAIDLNGDIPF